MAGEYDINLSNGSVLTTLRPLETNGPNNISTPRRITQSRPIFSIVQVGSISPNTVIKITGNVTKYFPVNATIILENSGANNGSYSIANLPIPGAGSPSTNGSWYDSGQDETNIILDAILANPPAAIGGDVIRNVFVIADDMTYRFVPGFTFDVMDSGPLTGSPANLNDGTYTVDSSYVAGEYTFITPTTLIPNTGLPNGVIQYTNPDSCSSLQLPGPGTLKYGEKIVEDIVRMTEHFAADTSPDLNSIITGNGPAADPLVGQMWYRTLSGQEGFLHWNGTEWTSDINLSTGSLTFSDTEDGNKIIHVAASETDLPAPWNEASPTDPSNNQPGLVIWNESNPPDNEAVFRVLAADGEELLDVEYNSTANAGYIRTINNIDIQGQGVSNFDGSIRVGNVGTIQAVNGDEIQFLSDDKLTIQSPGLLQIETTTGAANIRFDSVGDINSIAVGTNNVDSGNGTNITSSGGNVNIRAEHPSGDSANTVSIYADDDVVVESGTDTTDLFNVQRPTQIDNPVGINNVPPTGSPVWLEVTGDIQANSQYKGSFQTSASPTYSFTSASSSGMYYDNGNSRVAFAVGGNDVLYVESNGTISVANGSYTSLITDANDIVNKEYVDVSIESLSWREPVDVRAQTTYADSSAFPTTGTIDGITITTGLRVLFSDVTTVADRNVYTFDGAAWQLDANNSRTIGDAVYVKDGTDFGTIYAWNKEDDWDVISGSGGGGTFFVRESFSASASQTIFNLANPYLPSVDGSHLIVFVDGVKYIKDVGYTETNATSVTLIPPSPFVGGERVEFYILNETSEGTKFNREYQTGLIGNPTITFSLISYALGSDSLYVYVNGQKAIHGVDYTEVTSNSISWIGISLTSNDHLEFYAALPITAGSNLENIENVSSSTPLDGNILQYNITTGLWEYQTPATALTASAEITREYQTGLTGTPTISFNDITYVVGDDKLLVYVNGQKALINEDYTEVTSSTIDWIGTPLVSGDHLEFFSAIPVTAGKNLNDIEDVANDAPVQGDVLIYDNNKWESTNLSNIGNNENILINGNFEIWQRGNSFGGTPPGNIFADRWFMLDTGTTGGSTSITHIDTSEQLGHYASFVVSGHTTPYYMSYRIELNQSLYEYSEQAFNTAIRMSNTSTVNMFCRFYLIHTGGSNLIATSDVKNVNASSGAGTITNWTTTLPDLSSYNLDNNSYIRLEFHTSAALPDGTYNFFQAQMTKGSFFPGFTKRPYGEELALCQRYYETGASTIVAYSLNGNSVGYKDRFAVKKRTVPVLSFTTTPQYTNGTNGQLASASSEDFLFQCIATANDNVSFSAGWDADAEL